MARSTLSVSCGVGPSAIASWWSRASCFVFQKKFYHHIHKQCYLWTFFFYFLTSFFHCLLIRMVASQASCFVFQKKFQSSHSQALFSFNPPFFLTSFVFVDSDGWFTSILFSFKGSVERSLLPSAIFLIFRRNMPWKAEDHLCTLFFNEMSKERLEKSERPQPVSWRPWALAYNCNRPYNFSCLSAMSKNVRLRSFFSALGCHLARKSLSWPAMPVFNKKQEFEQRKRIKLFDDFWVREYRFDFAPGRRPRARSM